MDHDGGIWAYRSPFLTNVDCRSTHVFYEDYAPGKLTVVVLMPTNESMVLIKLCLSYFEP